MDLYTSLVRLKQEMNDGVVPPMTPVPENVHNLIDPSFTIGLGALEECAERGLRCPVRGCGCYRHYLTFHLNRVHGDIGGAHAIKRALSIPTSAILASRRQRELLSKRYAEALLADPSLRERRLRALQESNATLTSTDRRRLQKRTNTSRNGSVRSVGARNLTNTCKAQLSHKLIDLHHKLGRSPILSEAQHLLGHAFVYAVLRVFGTWNSAKAQCGLESHAIGRRRTTRAAALEALNAWYEQHGSLPSGYQAASFRRPLMPARMTILNAFETSSWPEAMRIAASLLDIRGGRYGLPEKRTA